LVSFFILVYLISKNRLSDLRATVIGVIAIHASGGIINAVRRGTLGSRLDKTNPPEKENGRD
jgi:hypothetical protein